jgi:hypothetical protein
MSAVKLAKSYGFKSFMQVIELSGYPRQTLKDMYLRHPVRFETILLGCKAKAQQALDKDKGE